MTLRKFIVLMLICQTGFASRVAVIRDSDAVIYSKVVLGVGVEISLPFAEYSLEGQANVGSHTVQTAIQNGAEVIIAIGPKSANAAAKETKIPVIHCLVPNVDDYDLERPNVVGIRLEVPIKKQLSLLKEINPKLKNIAIVADREISSLLISRVKAEARSLGIEIEVAHAKMATQVSGSLNQMRNNIDALLLVSDPVALDVTSFDAMVKYARQEKIPLMALDDGFVSRGALLSFAIDYGLTGRQAASVANRVLHDAMSFKDIRIVEQEGLNLAVNIKVADELYSDGPFFKKILQIAAEQRYAVEAF